MIAEIETALVNFISGCLPDEVDVAPAHGDWDDSYVRNLLTDLPAVRIVFDGGAQETPETFISLESRWIVFVAIGWKGGDEASRRTGAAGAFSFLDVLVPALHKAKLKDPAGKTLTHANVESVENMWTASLQSVGIALYAIILNVEMAFDSDPSVSKSRLDDFLEAGVDFTLPDDPDADLPGGDFPVPQ